jgi:hypothetical protein
MVKRSLGMEPVTLESSMAFWRLIGSPGYQPSDEELRQKILASYERSNYPEGYSRHMAAIIANGSRVKMLDCQRQPRKNAGQDKGADSGHSWQG